MLALAVVAATAGAPRANPAGEVASARYPGIDEHLHLSSELTYEVTTAEVTRETVGDPAADPLAPLPLRDELRFRQVRTVFTPRLELGLSRGVWLSAALPLVVSQTRELTLAPGADRAGLTTVGDGLVGADGFDAQAPASAPGGDVLFRGVRRRGLTQVHAGFGVAPLDQGRDPTKPTWKLGAELRLAVGRVMRFSAADPASETGASTGVHELRVWTSFDRRFRHVEGWLEVSWQRPLYARTASLFADPGYGATRTDPGQRAGATFGLEATLAGADAGPDGVRLGLDVGAHLTAHFEGRDYSELWELFAYAGDPGRGGPLVLDADPVTPGVQALAHPGISNHEGYVDGGGQAALRLHVGRLGELALTGALGWASEHAISFADAGVDLPTCPTATPRCETEDNDVVNAGTTEVNPLHSRRIDLVGHRYRARASRMIALGVEARLRF